MFIKKLISYLLIVVITIFMLELSLRILGMIPVDSTSMINDDAIGIRMRANIPLGYSNQTNKFGFNDAETNENVTKIAGKRVAFIGDSFVFGVVQRDKNFVEVMQALLNEQNANVDIINLGIPSIGPKNYLQLLKHDARRLRAQAAYVMLFVGNDIIQSHPDFELRILLGAPRSVLRKPYMIGIHSDYLYSYRALRAVMRILKERYADNQDSPTGFSRANYLAVERQRSAIYKRDMSGYVKSSYDGIEKVIHDLKVAAEHDGVDLRVVIAPDEIQIDSGLRMAVLGEKALLQEVYDFHQPQRILSAQLRKAGIQYIDLLPGFLEASRTRVLYKSNDSHWNIEGNRLAAELIYKEWMQESGNSVSY